MDEEKIQRVESTKGNDSSHVSHSAATRVDRCPQNPRTQAVFGYLFVYSLDPSVSHYAHLALARTR